MRCNWAAVAALWPAFALTASAYQRTEAKAGQVEGTQDITVLDYSPSTAYAKFEIQCPGCIDTDDADDFLVFDLHVEPSNDLGTTTLIVNDARLEIFSSEIQDTSSCVVFVADSTGARHGINLSWSGTSDYYWIDDHVTQQISLRVEHEAAYTSPPSAGFIVLMRPTSQERLVGLISDSGSQVVDFTRMDEHLLPGSPQFENGVYETDGSSEDGSFDLGQELDSLHLLEAKSHEIQMQIAAKKNAITTNLREDRGKLCLKHLIQECDGVICSAKAIAQRLCDRLGIHTTVSHEYTHFKNRHMQNMLDLDSKANFAKISAKYYHSGMNHNPMEANIPLMLTKNASEYSSQPIDIVYANPLVRALQIIGAALGIAALFLFLKRRCMSMRRRVERAADLEQRRNERAYRRAARRALMRKRWENFVNAVNCFGRNDEHRTEDYEEKRALILQDAFLEQDLDAAEKGEIMEAEIRELRYAHEIVASLVRVDEHRYDLLTPIHDPPPTLVPLPRTPGPRSRASTYTLPSYTSETLPDYSSQPGDSDGSSSLVNGYTPSAPDEQVRRSPVSPLSETSSGRTRYTPTSSIRETSTRPSGETLRTRISEDTRLS